MTPTAPTTPTRILIKFPTRERPAQAARVVREMIRSSSKRHALRFVVVTDEDDSGAWPGVGLIPAHVDIEHRTMPPRSKIAACNAFTPPEGEWDILIMGSDDLWPAIEGWDDLVARRMQEHWPNLDGCLWFSDGHQQRLCTYPIIGANWHAKAGSVYPPCYRSLWADNEAHDAAAVRGRMAACLTETVLEHRHPAWGSAPTDALYTRNEAPYADDQAVYQSRRARGFDWPPVTLSILIPTVDSRGPLLARLLSALNRQINAGASIARRVEILIDRDQGVSGGGRAVGAKRTSLLRRSIGRYVAFIDDDDLVAPDYVASILTAIDAFEQTIGRPPDCVGFWLERLAFPFRWSGERYRHTIEAGPDARGNDRAVNHLNPVRRDLAAAAGFDEDRSWGEDAAYARRLHDSLRDMAWAGGDSTRYFYLDGPQSLTKPFAPGASGGAIAGANPRGGG